jgi:nitroimidazol reductase NimA-like FMN-containing flavoprotein (pyridoxamine 5'-phosphate oxidase superfamily)
MVIRDLSREECLRVLARARLARLACAHENQPYVVPVYLAYDEASECFYGFTTPGQKIEWMRANPLVCVEVDEIAAYDQWVSVIVSGRYEELPATPASNGGRLRSSERPQQVREAALAQSTNGSEESDDQRERAWQVLQTHPMWEEPGCTAWAARDHRDSAKSLISVFYRIPVDSVTGHEATRNARDEISYALPEMR